MRRYRGSRDRGFTSVQIALMVAGALLVLLAAYAIILAVGGSGSDPEASPTATGTVSASPTSGPTPSETGTPAAAWADVPAADRPPVIANPRPGEPAAREWAPWVWDYVGTDWGVGIWGEPGPGYNSDDPDAAQYLYQALYLVAPDGDWFRLYQLRTDVGLGVEATALDEHIVWITRYFYEADQTVQFDLDTGTASETWADAGFANAPPARNADGWFVNYVATLADGRMMWEGSGFGAPLNGVFFRSPGGAITPSTINPTLAGSGEDAPVCVGVDTAASVAIYEGYSYVEGQPVANWPARLLVQNLANDTWTVQTRLGPYGTPCQDDFAVTADYYVGLATRVDQSGLYRYYFDGRPDQPN